MREKSQKQNKLATVHVTTYYPSINSTFTKGHSSIKIMFSAAQNDLAKIAKKKAKNKINLQQCISLHIILSQIKLLQNDAKILKIMFPAAKNDWAKNAKNKAKNKTTLLQ